eukprot:gene19030-25625_t
MQALTQFAFVQHDADPSQFPPELCLLFEVNKARVSDPEYLEYVRGRLFDTFASTGNKSNDVHVYPTWRDFDPEAVGISQIWPESPWHLFSSEFRACFENRLDADDNDFSMCVGKYFPEHGCHQVQVRVTKACSGDVPSTVSVGVVDEGSHRAKQPQFQEATVPSSHNAKQPQCQAATIPRSHCAKQPQCQAATEPSSHRAKQPQ